MSPDFARRQKADQHRRGAYLYHSEINPVNKKIHGSNTFVLAKCPLASGHPEPAAPASKAQPKTDLTTEATEYTELSAHPSLCSLCAPW